MFRLISINTKEKNMLTETNINEEEITVSISKDGELIAMIPPYNEEEENLKTNKTEK